MAQLPQFNPNNDITSVNTAFQQLQNTWSATLNPLIASPLAQGRLIKSVSLVSGANTINHKLGRALQGYIITGMYGAFAQIYGSTSTMPALTLVLNSNAATTVDLYCF